MFYAKHVFFSVQFRTTDDAIKIRSNRKLLKQWPHLYMKYGRDQNKDMKRPDNEQPDEEVDELTNLAGNFSKKYCYNFSKTLDFFPKIKKNIFKFFFS